MSSSSPARRGILLVAMGVVAALFLAVIINLSPPMYQRAHGQPVAQAPIAQAQAAPQPFHIKHSTRSQVSNGVPVYTGKTCQPDTIRKVLLRGQSVSASGYESFRGRGGDSFGVDIYNGTTGKFITFRRYANNTCVRAYRSNDYLIRIFVNGNAAAGGLVPQAPSAQINLCPISRSWETASRSEKIHAKHVYLNKIGGWSNGSVNDMRNTYRNRFANMWKAVDRAGTGGYVQKHAPSLWYAFAQQNPMCWGVPAGASGEVTQDRKTSKRSVNYYVHHEKFSSRDSLHCKDDDGHVYIKRNTARWVLNNPPRYCWVQNDSILTWNPIGPGIFAWDDEAGSVDGNGRWVKVPVPLPGIAIEAWFKEDN